MSVETVVATDINDGSSNLGVICVLRLAFRFFRRPAGFANSFGQALVQAGT